MTVIDSRAIKLSRIMNLLAIKVSGIMISLAIKVSRTMIPRPIKVLRIFSVHWTTLTKIMHNENYNNGPALNQHWLNISCLPGTSHKYRVN